MKDILKAFILLSAHASHVGPHVYGGLKLEGVDQYQHQHGVHHH